MDVPARIAGHRTQSYTSTGSLFSRTWLPRARMWARRFDLVDGVNSRNASFECGLTQKGLAVIEARPR